jgi:hypothetical protein
MTTLVPGVDESSVREQATTRTSRKTAGVRTRDD